jgi:hypothetical protein
MEQFVVKEKLWNPKSYELLKLKHKECCTSNNETNELWFGSLDYAFFFRDLVLEWKCINENK